MRYGYVRKNTVVIATLIACLVFMTVVYAAFSQSLNVSVNSSIDTTWGVEITGISVKSTTGSASSVSYSYTATTATFNAKLLATGDTIVYNVTVKNTGTLKAKLDTLTETFAGLASKNGILQFSYSGISSGQTLTAGSSVTFTVTATLSTIVGIEDTNRVGRYVLSLGFVQST